MAEIASVVIAGVGLAGGGFLLDVAKIGYVTAVGAFLGGPPGAAVAFGVAGCVYVVSKVVSQS